MDNAIDNLIYVIEQLWIDYSCNKYARSWGYSPVGYVKTEAEAQTLCSQYLHEGTGWPFSEGELIPCRKYTAIMETSVELEDIRVKLQKMLLGAKKKRGLK